MGIVKNNEKIGGYRMIHLANNMEFELRGNFMPNISNSNRLKILEVSGTSVVIQMNNSKRRGVFPLESFHYWIKTNSLIYIENNEKITS